MPVELRELAEARATAAVYDRLAAAEQERIDTADAYGRHLLASGRVTQATRDERRDTLTTATGLVARRWRGNPDA